MKSTQTPRHLHCSVSPYATFEGTRVKAPDGVRRDDAKGYLEVAFATGAGPQVAHDVEVAGAERELVVARAEQADLRHVLHAEAAPPELQEGFENLAPELLRVVAECADSHTTETANPRASSCGAAPS